MAKKNLLLQFVMGRNNILTGLIPAMSLSILQFTWTLQKSPKMFVADRNFLYSIFTVQN